MADDVDVASRDQVRAAFTRLAPVLEKDDLLLVVLIGHATFDGVDAKFNLVGPDLEAADWKALVAPIRGKVVFVNTAAASAPFLSRLAGERRIVVTATDSGVQRYETVFPRFFVQAFGEAETDLDKDSRISVWEAFARASLGVRQYYRQKGQLTVEKPILDDTGDGVGKDAGATGADGAIASRTFFDDADDPARAGGPALSELVARRNALESELDELKKRKDFMRLAEYEKRRDEVVIEIARVSRKIRTEQAGRSEVVILRVWRARAEPASRRLPRVPTPRRAGLQRPGFLGATLAAREVDGASSSSRRGGRRSTHPGFAGEPDAPSSSPARSRRCATTTTWPTTRLESRPAASRPA